MFATLAGALPRPRDASEPAAGRAGVEGAAARSAGDTASVVDTDPAVDEAATILRTLIELQIEAGLEPLTDGGEAAVVDAGAPDALVDRWLAAAHAAPDRALKAMLVGPYTQGRASGGARRTRQRATLLAAEAANSGLRALVTAGCLMIQVDEPDAVAIGDSPAERRLLADAHRRLTDGVDAVHLSLAITGGDAEATGAETLFELPYASYLFDLIAGPDSWRVIARAPTERGIICGVVPATEGPAVVKEALVWAAHYAASINARGLDRVGLATAGSLAGLSWDLAASRVRMLGAAARIAADDSPEHLARELDPRAVGMKSAAAGRNLPIPERVARRKRGR